MHDERHMERYMKQILPTNMNKLTTLACALLPLAAAATELKDMTSDVVKADGYTITLDVDLSDVKGGEPLYEIPGSLALSIREAGKDPALGDYDRFGGNYLNFPGRDGRCLVVEALLPGPAGRVGLPLSVLGRADGADGAHRIVLDWRKYRFQMSCGARADFDFPWKAPVWNAGAQGRTLSPRVKSVAFVSPAKSKSAVADFYADGQKIDAPIQYWTPEDHNAWVGDVAVCRYKGRFHVFYLYDRRHHRSKDGKGGHIFAHISSADLRNWVHHPIAVPIEDWWQTAGTGTPFEKDGRLYLTYGWHTSRLMPESETTYPAMNEYFRKHGKMGVFKYSEIKGYPMGGTYCWSDDGAHFTNSDILFHTAQNPTVYNRTDGRLGLVNSYGGTHGYYVSDHLGDWEMYDDTIPISGDCPCPFEWNGRHYLLQGFDGMAYSPDGKPGTFVNWTKTGDSVYGGLSVPMVAPWGDNRRIIVGWINHVGGWGGWLCFRELIQFEDGKLGEKWLDETMPPVRRVAMKDGRADVGVAYDLLEFRDLPSDRDFKLLFTDPKTKKGVEFGVDPKRARAWYAYVREDGRRADAVTLREAGLPEARGRRYSKPQECASYAIEHIRSLDRAYGVRLIVRYDPKSDVTILDAEIAGARTMICRREGHLTVAERE